jgi:hypothetical protein
VLGADATGAGAGAGATAGAVMSFASWIFMCGRVRLPLARIARTPATVTCAVTVAGAPRRAVTISGFPAPIWRVTRFAALDLAETMTCTV